jgi:hypothetical protein
MDQVDGLDFVYDFFVNLQDREGLCSTLNHPKLRRVSARQNPKLLFDFAFWSRE